MKIHRIDIDGFGVWTNLTMEGLSGKATLFYGPNEAGKTTLMQFVRTVLYGYNPQRRKRYFPPVHGGQAGGGLQMSTSSGNFTVRRQLREGEGGEGGVTVQASDGSLQSPRQLSVLLEGVDEAIYNNVFAVGLAELMELGSLNDTDAAEQLYNLTAGLDRVSLGDVMRDLEATRYDIAGTDPRKSVIGVLLEKRRKLQSQLDDFAQRGRNWGRLSATRNQLDRDIATQEENLRATQLAARILETAQKVRAQWQERRNVEARLSGLGSLRPLPPAAIAQLDKFNEQIVAQQKQHDEYVRARKELHEQAAALPINEGIARNALKIVAMREHEEWIGQLIAHIERLEAEISTLERDVSSAHIDLGMKDPAATKRFLHVTAPALAAVRKPAKVIRREMDRLQKAQKAAEAACEEATQIEHRIKSACDDFQEPDLQTAFENQQDLCERLAARAELDDKLEDLERKVNELENHNFDLLEQQVLPMQNMPWVAGLFAIGVMLLLAGLLGKALWLSDGTSWFLVLLGMGGLLLAIATKTSTEQTVNDQIGNSGRQLDHLRQQLKKAHDERDELDALLPEGQGSYTGRLKAAQQRLSELEDLMPLESQRQDALAKAEAAEKQASESERMLKAARHRWKQGLRTAGLPENLSPSEVFKLAKSGDQITEVRRKLDSRGEEITQKRRELSTFGERILILLVEAELEPENASPLDQLKQLVNALEQQEKQMARRQNLRRQAKIAKKNQMKANKGIDLLMKRKVAFLAKLGAESEAELRELASQHGLAENLRRNRERLSAEIVDAVTGVCPEDTLRTELEDDGRLVTERELEDREHRLAAQKDDIQAALKVFYEKRGQLVEQMKQIASDRRLAEAQLELDCIEHQLKQQIEKWQVLASTQWLLSEVRRLYESQRQPATLQGASKYLSDLSGGQYVRIWTPFGERELMIDDNMGTALSVELLSRGTREAVFLALRLALIDAYAERGANLPVVLDDVLVNFDTRRAKSTAMVIRDFAARGHQIFFFTCHEHIMRIFKSLKVDVRELPSRQGAPPPLPIEEEIIPEEPVVLKKKKKVAPITEVPVAVAPPPVPKPVVRPVVKPVALPVVEEVFTLAPPEPRVVAPMEYALADDFIGTPLPVIDIKEIRPIELQVQRIREVSLPVLTQPAAKVEKKPEPVSATIVPPPHFAMHADPRGQRFTWDEPRILWEDEELAQER